MTCLVTYCWRLFFFEDFAQWHIWIIVLVIVAVILVIVAAVINHGRWDFTYVTKLRSNYWWFDGLQYLLSLLWWTNQNIFNPNPTFHLGKSCHGGQDTVYSKSRTCELCVSASVRKRVEAEEENSGKGAEKAQVWPLKRNHKLSTGQFRVFRVLAQR